MTVFRIEREEGRNGIKQHIFYISYIAWPVKQRELMWLRVCYIPELILLIALKALFIFMKFSVRE